MGVTNTAGEMFVLNRRTVQKSVMRFGLGEMAGGVNLLSIT